MVLPHRGGVPGAGSWNGHSGVGAPPPIFLNVSCGQRRLFTTCTRAMSTNSVEEASYSSHGQSLLRKGSSDGVLPVAPSDLGSRCSRHCVAQSS